MKILHRYWIPSAFILFFCIWQNKVQAQQKFIKLSSKQIASGESEKTLRTEVGLGENDEMRIFKEEKDHLGFTHFTYQQYYKGIKVEKGIYKVHHKEGFIQSMNGAFFSISEKFNIVANMNGEKALEKALKHVGAEKYMWENPNEEALLKKDKDNPKASYFPKAELVIYPLNKTALNKKITVPTLAYKFDIYAQKPLSRAYIYVNAHTGEIIQKVDIIHNNFNTNNKKTKIPTKKKFLVAGTADTRFSGTQNIETTLIGSNYVLRDATRGNGVETYNMQTGTDYSSAIDFEDADNNWTSAEWDNAAKDNAALDAHYATMQTYDYFFNEHGRNSIDGAGFTLKSYVHYDLNFVNAFWDGSRMTYGDGDGSVEPLTVLDIVAHEVGHGLMSFTADLDYSDAVESGAMNEGFSDIWAICVEDYSIDPSNPDDADKNIWVVGEETGLSIRSPENPKLNNNPDTYEGDFWETNPASPHNNSTVLSHWFYILSEGKSGTNDKGDTYNVTGIGIDKAADVAYRMLTVYLTASSQYIDARTAAINAANDLYGGGSLEVTSVTNAWFAVGVGGPAVDNDLNVSAIEVTISSCELTSNTPIEITINNSGLLDQNAYDVNYEVKKADGTIVVQGTENVSTTLIAGQNASLTIEADLSEGGSYTTEVEVVLAGDEYAGNDILSETFTNGKFSLENDNVYTQDFENIEGFSNIAWSVEDTNNDSNTWGWEGEESTIAHSGSGFIGYIMNFDGVTAAEDKLYTNCFEMNAGENYEISFYYRGFTFAGAPLGTQKLKVYVASSDNSTSVLLEDFNSITNAEYEQAVLNFEATETGLYHIIFEVYSDASQFFALVLDDLEVKSTGVVSSLDNELNENQIKIYPNPASEQVNITLDNTIGQGKEILVELMNAEGKILQSSHIKNTVEVQTIDVSYLPTSTYILKFVASNGKVLKKRLVVSR